MPEADDITWCPIVTGLPEACLPAAEALDACAAVICEDVAFLAAALVALAAEALTDPVIVLPATVDTDVTYDSRMVPAWARLPDTAVADVYATDIVPVRAFAPVAEI